MTISHYWITKRTESIDKLYIEQRDYFVHKSDEADDLMKSIYDSTTDAMRDRHFVAFIDDDLIEIKSADEIITVTKSAAYTEPEMVAAGLLDGPSVFNPALWGDILSFEVTA